MALFETLTSQNMVTTHGLVVRYNVNKKSLETTPPIDYYEYVRTASKRYKYVGLTKAAALAGVATKMGKYTRSYSIAPTLPQILEPTAVYSSPVTKCTTGIEPLHEAGNMWSLEISVDEQDTKLSLSPSLAPGDVFNAEKARDYDDDEAMPIVIEVSQASYGAGVLTIAFSYAQSLGELSPDAITAEVWLPVDGVWRKADITAISSGAGTAQISGAEAEFANASFRLSYGPYRSNEESCDPA